MDSRAEFTLRIARAAQEALDPRSSMIDWVFFPEHRHVTWPQASEILDKASKPLLVAPLLEPGTIAIWSVNSLRPEQQAALQQEFVNQDEYLSKKLVKIGLSESDYVETPDGLLRITVGDFRRWATEYAVTFGISLTRSLDPHIGRILIRPPGGGRPPIGWIDPQTLAKSC